MIFRNHNLVRYDMVVSQFNTFFDRGIKGVSEIVIFVNYTRAFSIKSSVFETLE